MSEYAVPIGFMEECEERGLDHALDFYELQVIKYVLDLYRGNKSRAAKHVKMKRTTFVMKCVKHGIALKNKEAICDPTSSITS